MARNARNLRILDEFYRIGTAGVLGNADVCVIPQMVLIEHNVLEHRAETKRLKDLRFVLGRQIDGLGVAAAFNVRPSESRHANPALCAAGGFPRGPLTMFWSRELRVP